MKDLLKNNGWNRVGAALTIGCALGYGYYYFIGCHAGSCAITSNPVNSTIYGALIGILWVWPVKKKKGKES